MEETGCQRSVKEGGNQYEMYFNAAQAEAGTEVRRYGMASTPGMKLHVGCSGWYYRHWEGDFYPRGEPSHKWFRHYTRVFDTVELNAPFYNWPKPATVKTWVRQARDNDRFVYSVKVNGLITHEKRFVGVKRQVKEFCSLGEVLGEKMGCFLFQMPPSYRYTPARLRRVLEALDPRWRNVLEFRHKGWWNEEVTAALRAATAGMKRDGGSVIFCGSSGPRMPGGVVKTAPDVYLRFHGVKEWYRHDYTAADLEPWVKAVRRSRARRVWAYFNNDRNGHAIRNALLLRAMLEADRRPGPTSRTDTQTPAESSAAPSGLSPPC
jgi:uncharacterized protein YecE (DUF72 family)